MNVLSIQSHVAYGHVGNSAAVFALQRLGHEVWPVHTVQFSNHPGYGGFRGRPLGSDEVTEVILGLEELGVLARCDAVLSGYLADPATGAAVLDAVARVKAANPDAVYLCDPVMGDRESGLYVQADIPAFLSADAIPAADIVTPNAFELETLAGEPVEDARSARAVLGSLRSLGPGTAVVTGLDAGDGTIQTVSVDEGPAWMVETPAIQTTTRPDGAGDLFAAVFLGVFIRGRKVDAALSHAVSSVHAVLQATVAAGLREMRIIDAQAELAAPTHVFPSRRLS